MKEFIQNLPKAELHLHLEGSLEPEQMFEFAKRNAVSIPFASVDEVRAAYSFSSLQDFLNIYYTGMQVLLEEQDFYELTAAYLNRVAQQGVRHVEVFFDPQGHTERGLEFSTVINGISAALTQVGGELNISHKLIMCFLRHLSEDSALQTLETATPFLEKIHGVGLDSSELGNPPAKFENVFRQAKEVGLKRVAHAGEEGPPDYIWQALNTLEIDRLDHGNRSLEDPTLVQHLRSKQMALTLCPLSNLQLCVIDSMESHPIKTMLNKDLLVTVNSDDPAYFGGYLNENYHTVAKALQLDKEHLITIAKNGFIGSFLAESEKQALLMEVDAYASQFS